MRGAVRLMSRAVGALLRKELRLELRAPQAVPAMALFSVTTLVVFHFALQRSRRVEGDLAAGVLWVTLLFAAMLGHQPAVRRRATRRAASTASCSRPSTARRCSSPRRWRCSASSPPSSSSRVPAFALLLLGPAPAPALPGLRRSSCCSPTPGIARRRHARRRARDPDPRARPASSRCWRCRCSSRWSSRRREATAPLLPGGGAEAAPRPLAGRPRRSMIWSSGCSPTRSSTSCSRTDRRVRQRAAGPRPPHRRRRSRPRFALAFFYAPHGRRPGLHAEDLLRARAAGDRGAVRLRLSAGSWRIQHLRTRDARYDLRSYVAIHLSLVLGVGVLITGSIWAKASWGHWWVWDEPTLVSFLIVFLLYATYQPLRFSIEDPRAPGALRVGLRGHRRRVRPAELPRRAPRRRPTCTRACSRPPTAACPARCSCRSSSPRRHGAAVRDAVELRDGGQAAPCRSCARCAASSAATTPAPPRRSAAPML